VTHGLDLYDSSLSDSSEREEDCDCVSNILSEQGSVKPYCLVKLSFLLNGKPEERMGYLKYLAKKHINCTMGKKKYTILHYLLKRLSILNKDRYLVRIRKIMKMVEYLLENGADPNIKNLRGVTPLDFCQKIKFTYRDIFSRKIVSKRRRRKRGKKLKPRKKIKYSTLVELIKKYGGKSSHELSNGTKHEYEYLNYV